MDQDPLIWTRTGPEPDQDRNRERTVVKSKDQIRTVTITKRRSPCSRTTVLVLCTHVLVGGLVGADQVRVEPRQPDNRPDGEETHHHLQDGAEQSQGQTVDSVQKETSSSRQQRRSPRTKLRVLSSDPEGPSVSSRGDEVLQTRRQILKLISQEFCCRTLEDTCPE